MVLEAEPSASPGVSTLEPVARSLLLNTPPVVERVEGGLGLGDPCASLGFGSSIIPH